MGAEGETAARALYEKLIEAWNKRNARDFALLFASDGSIVGYVVPRPKVIPLPGL